MTKIKTLFERNLATHVVIDEVAHGCEWVIAGEGKATRKYDGSAVMSDSSGMWKRYDAKKGKTPPAKFMPAQERPDLITGHWPGWVPIDVDAPEDQWFREAIANYVKNVVGVVEFGTYEAIGPHFQGNPERVTADILVRHGADILRTVPLHFQGLRDYLSDGAMEGIVWHHPDGRMVKIKGRDFGIKRRVG